MSKQACGRCGTDPAEGFATVNGVRYCHGDWEPNPTCYMRAQGIDFTRDDSQAYDLSDPKHPIWHDRMSDLADR